MLLSNLEWPVPTQFCFVGHCTDGRRRRKNFVSKKINIWIGRRRGFHDVKPSQFKKIVFSLGTSINDVPHFLVIFDLPTYLVLLYNVPFFGLSWTPLPTLLRDVINERSLKFFCHSSSRHTNRNNCALKQIWKDFLVIMTMT